MQIQTNMNSPQFSGLIIKKNIIQDLPMILKNHENILRNNVGDGDSFSSAYGTVRPKRMLELVHTNQEKNKNTHIVIGYFRFGLNPFKNKTPGIALKKGNKTILKEKLETDITIRNNEDDKKFLTKREILSKMYEQFSQAEKIANLIEKFSSSTK